MNIWFASDHHLGHKNIIAYENRPFKDVEEMNKTIIERHNSVVKSDDIVYFLGDFCMGNKAQMAEYIKKFKGRISLILGNHDRFKPTDYIESGFAWASRFSIIYNSRLILSHEPIIDNEALIGRWFYNIHGHLHSKETGRLGYFNCSVERINYLPVHITTIEKMLYLN